MKKKPVDLDHQIIHTFPGSPHLSAVFVWAWEIWRRQVTQPVIFTFNGSRITIEEEK